MGPLGWQETVVIFVVALLIFGPKKMPELGRTLAKAMGEFRRASNELKDTFHREMSAIEEEGKEIKQVADDYTNQVTSACNGPSDYSSDNGYDDYGYQYNQEYNPEEPDSSQVTSVEGASATQGANSISGTDSPNADAPEGTVTASMNSAGESSDGLVSADAGKPASVAPAAGD
jgi:sec-independent protein translocase protein TatA